MNDPNSTTEAAVRRIAATFPYPPTPDIAAGVGRRLLSGKPAGRATRRPRRALAFAAVLLLLLAALLAVPPLRASLVNIFRAGAVTVSVGPAEPALVSDGTPLAESLRAIARPVTLAQAQAQFPAGLQLPAALDEPDELYLHQGQEFDIVISFWRDAQRPEQIAYALYQIDAAQYANKAAERLEPVTVDGHPGFWLVGDHFFILQDRTVATRTFVTGSALVWWDGPLTYRLEGAASLAEAIRIAESLQPVSQTD